MKDYIRDELNNNTDLFCTRMAGFFQYTLKPKHLVSLQNYNPKKVDEIFREKFNINDDVTIELVKFLMKL